MSTSTERGHGPLFIPAAAAAAGIGVGTLVFLSRTDNEQTIPGKVILVADALSPQDVLAMQEFNVAGFITAQGSLTGFPLIMARNRGFPALVGLGQELARLEHGQQAIIDGNSGGVWLSPSASQLQEAESSLENSTFDQPANHLPAETTDGKRVDILANIELAEQASLAVIMGAQGIGLFRSEFYYNHGHALPDEQTLAAMYQHLLVTLSPMPVTVKLLDFGSPRHDALGMRASRLHPRDIPLIHSQLRALFQAAPGGTLRLLCPMLSSARELDKIKEMMGRAAEEVLGHSGKKTTKIELGMLLEIPAAVALIEQVSGEIDFITIGSNDLIQFCCGADRDLAELVDLYDPLQPAVVECIARAVECGHDHGLEVGLCGEMAADPSYLPLLLGLGLDNLSVTPNQIPKIIRQVRASSYQEAVRLTNSIRRSAAHQRHAILNTHRQ